MSTDGPYDVVLHLATPNVALSFGLVNERVMSPAQLANLGSSFGNDPVCVGPFRFQSDVPGQSVTVVRSPYYYDKKDVHLDKIVFTAETSDLAAASALEAGDVQALDQVPQDVLKSVEQNGFRVLGHLSIGFHFIEINVGNSNGINSPYSSPGTPIASSPLLREAFEMAIDRKTLNRVVFGGLNVPGCTLISPAAPDWYDPAVKCTPYDPVQARKLVQQSGYSNPTVQLSYGSGVQNQVLAQFVQSEEQAVGINVTLDPTDPTTLSARLNSGAYQTCCGRDHPGQERPRLAVRQLPRDQRATVQPVRLFEPARDARSREQPQGGERPGPEDGRRRRAEGSCSQTVRGSSSTTSSTGRRSRTS